MTKAKQYHIPFILTMLVILLCSQKPALSQIKAKGTSQPTATETTIIKPPFFATPLGQPLDALHDQSDSARATPTKNSTRGGFPGLTRKQWNGNPKNHDGLDDPTDNPEWVVARYTGVGPGKVIEVNENAFTIDKQTGKREGLGVLIKVAFKDKHGTWVSKTMHQRVALVARGQRVAPNQVIALGAGVGSQFNSGTSGEPHVHWELTLNGDVVNPLSGEIVRRNTTAASGPNQQAAMPAMQPAKNPGSSSGTSRHKDSESRDNLHADFFDRSGTRNGGGTGGGSKGGGGTDGGNKGENGAGGGGRGSVEAGTVTERNEKTGEVTSQRSIEGLEIRGDRHAGGDGGGSDDGGGDGGGSDDGGGDGGGSDGSGDSGNEPPVIGVQ